MQLHTTPSNLEDQLEHVCQSKKYNTESILIRFCRKKFLCCALFFSNIFILSLLLFQVLTDPRANSVVQKSFNAIENVMSIKNVTKQM